ncbi:MAG: TlpA family protein disulfide reductase [Armatimonadetes bacterium]|nr:TlpA family protein disulfide reductase [Armatimonadota bacterium]
MWEKYRDRGLVVLGINTGERVENPAGKAKQFRDQHGLTFPILVDPEGRTMDLYGGTALPTNAVLDREGNLRYCAPGYDEAALDALVRSLLGGS